MKFFEYLKEDLKHALYVMELIEFKSEQDDNPCHDVVHCVEEIKKKMVGTRNMTLMRCNCGKEWYASSEERTGKCLTQEDWYMKRNDINPK